MTDGAAAAAAAGNVASRNAAEPATVRVLLCENDPIMSAALDEFLSSSPGLELVGMAGDAEEGIAAAREARPDVVILDVRMPKGGGARAARQIHADLPHARLIAFSAHADHDSVMEMLRAGVSEYLIKGVDNRELLEAVRRTGRGRVSLPSLELQELLAEAVEMLVEAESLVAERATTLTGRAQGAV